MQYILTEEEYRELRKNDNLQRIKKERLLEICKLASDYIPIDNETGPWGCIRSNNNHLYCDKCPVKDICPYEFKVWSK